MKLLSKICVLLLTLQIVYSEQLDENDEEHKIQEFLKYAHSITTAMYNDGLAITRQSCEEILNKIPLEKRGKLSASLQKFIDDAARAELSSNNDEKKVVLDSMTLIIMSSLQPGSEPTPETAAVGMNLLGLLFAAKRVNDERNVKLLSASKDLKSKFTSEGITRNQKLFDLLNSYENEKDDEKRELIITDILAIKLIDQIATHDSEELVENQEKHDIQEFLKYIDAITSTMYNDGLALTRKHCEDILNKIPVERRGKLSEALKKIIDNTARAELSSNNEDKRAVIESIKFIIMITLQPGSEPSTESTLIGMNLFGLLSATRKISEERNIKLLSASKILKSKFTPKGIKRNQLLFDLLRSYEIRTNDMRREIILKDIMAIKV